MSARSRQIKRDVKARFAASDEFWEKMDQARASARRPRLSGQRLDREVRNRFDQDEAEERAEERAFGLALETITGLIARHRSGPRDSGSGLSFMSEPTPDPLGDLLSEHAELAEVYGDLATNALLGDLAQLAAAAVHELAETTGRKPGATLKALLGKYSAGG